MRVIEAKEADPASGAASPPPPTAPVPRAAPCSTPHDSRADLASPRLAGQRNASNWMAQQAMESPKEGREGVGQEKKDGQSRRHGGRLFCTFCKTPFDPEKNKEQAWVSCSYTGAWFHYTCAGALIDDEGMGRDGRDGFACKEVRGMKKGRKIAEEVAEAVKLSRVLGLEQPLPGRRDAAFPFVLS